MRYTCNLPTGFGSTRHPGNGGLFSRVAHDGEVDRRRTSCQRGEDARSRPVAGLGRTVGLHVNGVGGAGVEPGHIVESIRDVGDGGAAAKGVESAGFAVHEIPAVNRLLEVHPAEVGGVGLDVGHRGGEACTTGDDVGDLEVRTVGADGVGRRRAGRVAGGEGGAETADMRVAALRGVLITTVRVVGGIVGVRTAEGDTHHDVAAAVPNERSVKIDIEPADAGGDPVAGVHQGERVERSPVGRTGVIVIGAVTHVGADVRHGRCARRVVERNREDDSTGRHVGCCELGSPVDLLTP